MSPPRHARAAARIALLVLAALSGAARPAAQVPAPPPAAAQAPTVVAIQVEGERRYTERQLLDALGQRIGEPLDSLRLQKGAQTLMEALHVRAEVHVRDVPGGVELRLEVVEMPVDLEPRFVGNQEIDKETLLRWAQLPERGELYLYQAERVRTRLLEGYRQEGYAFAEVDVVKRGETVAGELPDVIFEIREGPQVHVSDLVVHGNRSLPERGMWFWREGLTKFAGIETSGPSLFDWYGSEYDEEQIQADLLAMREVYRERGWLDAVVELLEPEFSPDRSRVTIHVIVDEGPTYTVRNLSLKAFARVEDPQSRVDALEQPVELLYPAAELLALCKLEPGARYSRLLQEQDAAALRKHYGKHGYLSHPSLGLTSWAFLEPELHFVEGHQIDVTYRIAQGQQRFVREVLFEGAQHSRDRVLRREVDVLPGARADIEEITRSLNRLYSTNWFSDEFAPLDHHDPTFRFVPVEGAPGWVDLYYEVEEGRVVDLQLTGGISSDNGAFGRILLEMRNFDLFNPPSSVWDMPGEVYDKEAFHGAGQRLVLELSPGTEINSYQMRFVEPDLFGSHFNRTIFDFELSRRVRTYSFYDEGRDTAKVRLGREFGRNWTLFGGYQHVNLEVSDIEADVVGIVPPDELPLPPTLFAQEGETQLVGPLMDLHYRNLDRTLNPTDGFRAIWRNSVYGGAFAGDWDFVRSELDLDWYWPMGPEDQDVRPGFHLALGAGLADPYGSTADVPYTERFFLGGTRSLRGFDFRGVGPNQGGEPLGGESMLNASLEYRLPLYTVAQPGTYKQVEVFHLKLFTDVGILDPEAWKLDFDELRASVGFGVGMSHPLPISLNFGFPIESGEGDQEQVFSFNIVNISF